VARVKICSNPNCGSKNAPGAPFCIEPGCGYALADVDVVDEPIAADSNTSKAIEPSSGMLPPVVAHDDRTREPAPRRRAVLAFPWGETEISETLFVGRDSSFSMLANILENEGYVKVSRKHAELYLEDGKLYVRDVGSTNGTFVNGERIENRPISLSNGDQLGFSSQLVATVHLD
jgi:FHA domain